MLLASMVFKDSVSVYLSELARPKDFTGIKSPETVHIDTAFDYSRGSQLTFFGFESITYFGWKKMEKVMQMGRKTPYTN